MARLRRPRLSAVVEPVTAADKARLRRLLTRASDRWTPSGGSDPAYSELCELGILSAQFRLAFGPIAAAEMSQAVADAVHDLRLARTREVAAKVAASARLPIDNVLDVIWTQNNP